MDSIRNIDNNMVITLVIDVTRLIVGIILFDKNIKSLRCTLETNKYHTSIILQLKNQIIIFEIRIIHVSMKSSCI